jgi:hypothetical protein
MADLSPAAQAVLNEVLYQMCAGESESYAASIAAATVRAAADQVIDGRCQNESEKRICDRLHRIATELEAQ